MMNMLHQSAFGLFQFGTMRKSTWEVGVTLRKMEIHQINYKKFKDRFNFKFEIFSFKTGDLIKKMDGILDHGILVVASN